MAIRASIRVVVLALACVGCDLHVLSTEVGEHVVYHWDAETAQLCGGTVPAIHAVVAAIPRHYGFALAEPESGPTIDYFWTAGYDYAQSVCGWGGGSACAPSGLVAGPTVYSTVAIHGHELAHAALDSANTSLNMPAAIDEGIASRWQGFILADEGPGQTYYGFSEAQLREQFSISYFDLDYELLRTWWITLEVVYGAHAMGELLVALDAPTSADEMDETLREVLGISLAESAELASVYFGLALDDPACALTGLPSFTWTGEPIVLDRGPANCTDADVINRDDEVITLFEIQFPDDEIEVVVEFLGLDRDESASALLTRCDDHPYDFGRQWAHSGQANWFPLRDRVLVAPLAELGSDGSVDFPQLRVREAVLP